MNDEAPLIQNIEVINPKELSEIPSGSHLEASPPAITRMET